MQRGGRGDAYSPLRKREGKVIRVRGQPSWLELLENGRINIRAWDLKKDKGRLAERTQAHLAFN